MKNRTYYEILGVASHVGSGQIQAAYRFARSLYSGEAASSHGLLSAAERAQMLLLVEEAYAALSNPHTRRDYDIHLAATSPPAAVPFAPHAQAPPPPIPREEERVGANPNANPLGEEGGYEPIRVPEVVTGAVLRSLRESRKLSIDQIAALSKVGSRFLRALEEDRHSALPGRVFARGFLIEYARALRVPEAEVVDRYLRHWRAK